MASHSAKVAFYTNLTGTSPLEVALVVAVGPASELLRWVLVPCLIMVFGSVVKTFWFSFAVDFAILVLPLLSALTVWSGNLKMFLVALLVTSTTLLLAAYIFQPMKSHRAKRPSKASTTTPRHLWELPPESEHPFFMTMFRVHGMVASAITILAVDFPVFPRRFGKTEVYGTGLMDIAVGAFMFMNALVSKEARGKHQVIFSSGIVAGMKSLVKTLTSTLPFILLGVVRLVGVKSTGYHEHVSEYGVHWNFFFTLAVVITLSSVIFLIIPPSLSGLLSLAVAVGYQHLLSNHSLGQFVLHGSDGRGSREGLLDANREGIVSCVGYVAVYFAGVCAGRFLLKRRTLFLDWWLAFLLLIVINVLLWILLEATSTYIEPVCRRTANLPYIIWTLSFCMQLLASYMLVDIIVAVSKEFIWRTPQKSSRSKSKAASNPLVPDSILISALRPNLLLVFLLCNLLTGVINLSMDTINQSPAISVAVLVVYMLGLCLTALALHAKGIRLKFW